jgi:hypothetical protein
MRPTCWTWSARKSASLAVGTAVAGVNHVRARNSNACRETFILRAHLMPDYGGHLTGRYTPLSLISACNCKRHSSNAAPEDAGTPGACQGGSPLSLYSAGSLVLVHGFGHTCAAERIADGHRDQSQGTVLGGWIWRVLVGWCRLGTESREKPSIWCRVRSLT